MRTARIAGWIALAAVLPADAQSRVLHEYVSDSDISEAMLLVSGSDRAFDAIVYDGQILSAPRGGALREDERAMTSLPSGDGARPGPSYRPDRSTSLEATASYYVVFSPSIAPFKRVTALDAVELERDGTPVLRIRSDALRRVPIYNVTHGAEPDRLRDRFWGSIVVDFSEGATVPLPSVSPESRVLQMRTQPEVALSLAKDGADNFYVVASAGAPTKVRVTYLMDAPASYFGTRIPAVRNDTLEAEVAPLPAAVRASAERFTRELGVRKGAPLDRTLAVLTEHFRSFEESSEPPRNTGDVFLDLSRGKRGVCRHRAYGFVIAAHSLGIPARFVQNEAHAWVEVKLPDVGFMRIDLGGSPRGLQAHGNDGKPIYHPREPDRLPRPDAYVRAYAEAARRSQGAPNGSSPGGETRQNGDASRPVTPNESAGEGAERADTADAEAPSHTRKTALRVELEHQKYEAFRGRLIEVGGRVVDANGRGVEGMRIETSLRGRKNLLLGVTVSGKSGYFRGAFGVPPDARVGEYTLLVQTPGDARFAPARAR